MNPQIQANKRLTYLNTIPEAKELHEYIQNLDKKYGVDSSDPDNTFGRIFLDQPIVKHGVSNTLFFAGISTYRPEDLRLPKHKAIPHANTMIFIDNKGHVGLADLAAHVNAKKIPIQIEEKDILKLKELREAYKKAITENTPLYPDLSNTENHGFLDEDSNPIPFNDLPQWNKNQIYDRLLKEQNFANHSENHINVKLSVPGRYDDNTTFHIKYYRLNPNSTPYFSTTYDGCQAQDRMNHNTLAYTFYKKWNVFHLNIMTTEEWTEMKADLDELVKNNETHN